MTDISSRRTDPETGLIGRSAAIRVLEDEIDRAAHSDAQVLVMGEAGVGKEAVARLIHHRSPRVSAALVALTCAGLPDVLLESELFGHVRGGFTGAYRDKPGLLELARNGTAFVNDVGDMSTRLQLVLLRFLESGEIQRVGADRPHARVSVRVIAATTRDLRAQVRSGSFRGDLHDSLSGIRLVIPPLRDRTEDIPLLVESFLRSHGRRHEVAKRLSPDAMAALVAYRWPGNVRELKSALERAVLKTRGAVVGPRDLQLPRRPLKSAGLRPPVASESLPRTSRVATNPSA
jgi:transcriptional regulator with GAF, ATPase, and Fis domain